MALLFSGNVFALIIPFLVAPFITRIYTPEDIAAYELFAKLLGLIAAVAALRYELAVVLPKEEKESRSLMRLCMSWITIISVLSLVAVLFRHEIASWFENKGLAELIWLIPVGIFFTGIFASYSQLAMRLNLFKLMSGNKVMGAGSNHLSKLFFGYLIPGPSGLVFGHILGVVVPSISLVINNKIRKWMSRYNDRSIQLRGLMRKYKDFPLYNGSHSFYDEASKTLLFLIISKGYGEVTLGLFAFAFRYLRIPLTVMGASLSQVLTPELAKRKNDNIDNRPMVLKSIRVFSLIGVLPFAALMLFGGPVFSFIFGEEWTNAGVYAGIIAPWLYLNFITSPISIIPTIYGKQNFFLYVNIAWSSLTLIAVYLLYQSGRDFKSVLIAMTALNCTLHLFLSVWFYKIAGGRSHKSTRS